MGCCGYLIRRRRSYSQVFITVKECLFPDYKGTVKSLGAWGGDFVLAISETEDIPNYFLSKGFDICIPYDEIV